MEKENKINENQVGCHECDCVSFSLKTDHFSENTPTKIRVICNNCNEVQRNSMWYFFN